MRPTTMSAARASKKCWMAQNWTEAHSLPTTGIECYCLNNWILYWWKVLYFIRQPWHKMHRILQVQASNMILHGRTHWEDTVAIGDTKRHMRKASHCGNKERWSSHANITLLLLVSATYMYGVVLHTHPVRGESHNQRNTAGEFALELCPAKPWKSMPWKPAIIWLHSEWIQHRSAAIEYLTGIHGCEPPALLNIKSGHHLVCISVFSILMVFSRL